MKEINKMDRLLDVLELTHYNAAGRENSSTSVFNIAYQSNDGNFLKACAAAIGTFGGKHAPIKMTQEIIAVILSGSADRVNQRFVQGGIIAGLGNSFAKVDPLLDSIIIELSNYEQAEYARAVLESIGKPKGLKVNLAFCTAMTNIITGSNKGTLAMLNGRSQAWCDMTDNCYQQYNIEKSI